eukprot:13146392-Alexandrium_andersonii.AAC.1
MGQSGTDRLRGPEDHRTNSGVEQGESTCGWGERIVENVRDSPKGFPGSTIFLSFFRVLETIGVNDAAQDKDGAGGRKKGPLITDHGRR